MDTSSIEPRLSSYLHAKVCRAGTPLSGNFSELTARRISTAACATFI